MMTDRNKGIMLMVVGSLFFALMATFVKLSGDLPTVEKLFFRSIVGMAISGFWVYRTGSSFLGENKKLLLLRAVFGFLGLLFYFLAIDLLPLGNAVILNQMSPFFTIIFAFLFLQEHVLSMQWLAVVIAMTGVVLISSPGPGYTVIPAVIGLFSAIFSAAAYVTIRELAKTDRPHTIVFYFTTLTCLITFPLMVSGQYVPPTLPQAGSLLGVGIVATAAQFLLTNAYRYAEAGDLSIYSYGNTVFALIIGFLLWDEIPDTVSFLGVLLVFCGAYVNWRSRRRGKLKTKAE